MKSSSRAIPANRLLDALSDSARRRFIASCDRVELEFSKVLCDPGERIRHVYFPLTGFISLVTRLADGALLEVGIVGDEGMLGTPLVLGVRTAAQHALVQGEGTALRMNAATFSGYIRKSPPLRQHLNGYVHVLISQLTQTAACTHYHRVEERLARWLLMTRDRAHSDEFRLTHEFMAFMLGVRRVGITEAASALQKRGLISYQRGKIAILSGAGLEKASCACYRHALDLYEQTLRSRRNATARH